MCRSYSQSETEHKYRPCIGYGVAVLFAIFGMRWFTFPFNFRLFTIAAMLLLLLLFLSCRRRCRVRLSRAMGHIHTSNCIVAALNIQQTDATEANTITKHLILFYFVGEEQGNSSNFGVFCFHLNGFWLALPLLLLFKCVLHSVLRIKWI